MFEPWLRKVVINLIVTGMYVKSRNDMYVNVKKAYCLLLQVFELHARSSDGDLVSNEAWAFLIEHKA